MAPGMNLDAIAAALPDEILQRVAFHHLRIYVARVHLAKRKVNCEMRFVFEAARCTYYRELMDHENGGYGYMLSDDELDEEMDDCLTWHRFRIFNVLHDFAQRAKLNSHIRMIFPPYE